MSKRGALFHSGSSFPGVGDKTERESFLENDYGNHASKFEEQDEIMDKLHASVQRFGEQTQHMKSEIEEHLGLISSMQDDLEKNQNTLDRVNEKAKALIEKSGGECRVIALLSAVCIFLLMLVLYW